MSEWKAVENPSLLLFGLFIITRGRISCWAFYNMKTSHGIVACARKRAREKEKGRKRDNGFPVHALLAFSLSSFRANIQTSCGNVQYRKKKAL
jgi:hypothetical protein